MNRDKSYSTVEVASYAEVSVRQLDYWAKQGLLVPSVQTGHGRGSCRRYSLEDLTRLRFILRLKQGQMSLQKIRRILINLHQVSSDPNPLCHTLTIYESGRLIAIFKTVRGRNVLIEGLQAGGQHVLEFVLETLTKETKHELAQKK